MKNGVTQVHMVASNCRIVSPIWRPTIYVTSVDLFPLKIDQSSRPKKIENKKTRVPLTSVTTITEHDRRSLVEEISKREKPNILLRAGKK